MNRETTDEIIVYARSTESGYAKHSSKAYVHYTKQFCVTEKNVPEVSASL